MLVCVGVCWCLLVYAGVHSHVCNSSALNWAEQIAVWGASFNDSDSHTQCEGHSRSLHFQSCIGCVARHPVILIFILL